MTKPIFPDTNLCGQLFNDFLKEKPVLKIYAAKGKVVWQDKFMIEIELNQSKDCIHINHRNGKIACIEYETVSKNTINEIITFLDANYQKEPAFGKSPLDIYDIYNNDIFISVLNIAGTHYIGIRVV